MPILTKPTTHPIFIWPIYSCRLCPCCSTTCCHMIFITALKLCTVWTYPSLQAVLNKFFEWPFFIRQFFYWVCPDICLRLIFFINICLYQFYKNFFSFILLDLFCQFSSRRITITRILSFLTSPSKLSKNRKSLSLSPDTSTPLTEQFVWATIAG